MSEDHDDCTAVAETKTDAAPAGGVGRVSRVIGPVVDVEFPVDQMPDIYNALLVDTTVGGETRTMTMEVALHIGDNLVRAIALKPTDGMQRGTEVRDTGAPISVPVGDITKGHVWNVTGDVLDVDRLRRSQITERWPIHRSAPKFDQLESKTEMLETGIKVLDLLTPVRDRRQDRPVRRRRRGQDGADPGDDLPDRPQLRRHLGVRRRGGADP